MEAEAEAEAIALKGDAEAYAVECRAKAEAEQMAKKADAWKEYKEAAMIEMMIQTLPKVGLMWFFLNENDIWTRIYQCCLLQVAAEVAAPLSQVKKITMVSDGSGEVGASRITSEVRREMG